MSEDEIKFSCSDPEGLKKLEEQIKEINREVDTSYTGPTPDPSVLEPYIKNGRVYVPITGQWEREHGIVNELYRELKPDEPIYQVVRNGIEKDRQRRERGP